MINVENDLTRYSENPKNIGSLLTITNYNPNQECLSSKDYLGKYIQIDIVT